MKTIDLTPILQAVIMLLAALVTYRLVPWIKSRTTLHTQAALAAAVRVAVFAAEQIYGAGAGKTKLDYVINILRAEGFDLDVDVLRAYIEDMVHSMNTWGDLEPDHNEPPDDEPEAEG